MPDISPILAALNAGDLETHIVQRLFHGRGHIYPDLAFITLDWYPPALFVCLFEPVTQPWLDNLLTQLWQNKPELVSALVVQKRDGAGTVAEVIQGQLPRLHVVTERHVQDRQTFELAVQDRQTVASAVQDTHFYVQLNQSQNVGIFLDMINGRAWVKSHSHNRNVLNLFAYTCAFSLVALQGGASQVVNVDMNKSSMAVGRKNHVLNQLDESRVKFFTHDIFSSWGKIKRYGIYDLIIIDPPSFQKGSFVLTKDYQRLIRRLPELAASNADVLLCLNSPHLNCQFIFDLVALHCPQLIFVQRLSNHPNFVDSDPEKSLKVLWYRFGSA